MGRPQGAPPGEARWLVPRLDRGHGPHRGGAGGDAQDREEGRLHRPLPPRYRAPASWHRDALRRRPCPTPHPGQHARRSGVPPVLVHNRRAPAQGLASRRQSDQGVVRRGAGTKPPGQRALPRGAAAPRHGAARAALARRRARYARASRLRSEPRRLGNAAVALARRPDVGRGDRTGTRRQRAPARGRSSRAGPARRPGHRRRRRPERRLPPRGGEPHARRCRRRPPQPGPAHGRWDGRGHRVGPRRAHVPRHPRRPTLPRRLHRGVGRPALEGVSRRGPGAAHDRRPRRGLRGHRPQHGVHGGLVRAGPADRSGRRGHGAAVV